MVVTHPQYYLHMISSMAISVGSFTRLVYFLSSPYINKIPTKTELLSLEFILVSPSIDISDVSMHHKAAYPLFTRYVSEILEQFSNSSFLHSAKQTVCNFGKLLYLFSTTYITTMFEADDF
jgi:hypothetical protein